MRFLRRKYIGKLFLLIFAVVIGMGSLIYTSYLVSKLQAQERKNVKLWAQAINRLVLAKPEQEIDTLLISIVENNNTVPVILTDESDSIISFRNFENAKQADPVFMKKRLNRIRQKNNPIVINLDKGHYNLVYYSDSTNLSLLIYYPYVQVGIIIMFIFVSSLAFRSSRKAEQNQVWVSLSKETAHQLGTPTSSLGGWIEILQQRHPDIKITRELALDVQRLEKVTERFSRIGSKPALVRENINNIVSGAIDYLRSRTSSRVKFRHDERSKAGVTAPVNAALFEWVIENVSKNAIDAMEGNGTITIMISETDKHAIIDLSDTGKGIPKSLFKKIFNPGFTTKQRGWGVGLSLAKRIIEEYHHGKIFVRASEVGKGSTIRIILKKR
ncbi:MAG TPA: ATP-binding protein [Bacteroidales bacterium]|jgi:nitrogen-specific signal transduction histidine kinase|nr:ATP-binding protein [Bacteroidales bacterium]